MPPSMTSGNLYCKNLLSLGGEAVPVGRGLWVECCRAVGSVGSSGPSLQVALAAFSQVWRVQDRLPPDLPGRGEGLPPLCPPAQVPRTEHFHLTQSPALQRPQVRPQLSRPSRVCHQPGHSLKVSQLPPCQEDSGVTGTRACLPEGALDGTPPSAPGGGDASRTPLFGGLGRGACTNQAPADCTKVTPPSGPFTHSG